VGLWTLSHLEIPIVPCANWFYCTRERRKELGNTYLKGTGGVVDGGKDSFQEMKVVAVLGTFQSLRMAATPGKAKKKRKKKRKLTAKASYGWDSGGGISGID